MDTVSLGRVVRERSLRLGLADMHAREAAFGTTVPAHHRLALRLLSEQISSLVLLLLQMGLRRGVPGTGTLAGDGVA